MDAARMSMLEVLAYIEAELAAGAQAIELDALDPDLGAGLFAGETVDIDGETLVHRPLRTWLDLAERLALRLCTPSPLSPSRIQLRLERLAGDRLLRGPSGPEKYGTESPFARIDKREDARFVLDLRDALARTSLVRASLDPAAPRVPVPRVLTAPPETDARVLALGCNTGDELALVRAVSPSCTIVGVDHSASAIATARTRFAADARIAVHEADVASLVPEAYGRFDLVLALGLFQSGALDDRALLRAIVQDHLSPTGSVLLGIPNCRYIDGEVEYGARMKNFSEPELGLVIKDVAFYRKYLQQHHKQVFVTGKHYLLITAVDARP